MQTLVCYPRTGLLSLRRCPVSNAGVPPLRPSGQLGSAKMRPPCAPGQRSRRAAAHGVAEMRLGSSVWQGMVGVAWQGYSRCCKWAAEAARVMHVSQGGCICGTVGNLPTYLKCRRRSAICIHYFCFCSAVAGG